MNKYSIEPFVTQDHRRAGGAGTAELSPVLAQGANTFIAEALRRRRERGAVGDVSLRFH